MRRSTRQTICPRRTAHRRARHAGVGPGRRNRRSDLRAFTLVEVLVSLTITSLLVISVVSATRAISGTRSTMERRIERSAAARRAMETIVGALRNVRRDPVEDRPVVVGESGDSDGTNNKIDLLVIGDQRARPDGPESDQYEVSFYLTHDRNRPLPALLMRKDHAFDEHPDEGGVATVVAEGIVALSFEYYDGSVWQSVWSKLEPRPPEAVRVTLAAADAPTAGARRGMGTLVLSSAVRIRTNAPTQSPERQQSEQSNPDQQRQPRGGPGR